MNRTIAATAIALATLSAPAFAQTEQAQQTNDTVDASARVGQQYVRGVSGFLAQREYNTAHSERAQKIFDELRAEKGTGVTD